MNNLSESIETIVRHINELYESFRRLTSDELRQRVTDVQDHIRKSGNNLSYLESVMPEVYALVKETARRFATGDVVVTANAHDRELSGQYDFVRIEEDKAIYSNRWMAGGVMTEWRMVHYDEQLTAGIYLFHGYAIEMGTGEGKTLVATLPVFLYALTHGGVHVMTVNDYLSRRDSELTRPLYLFHGLSVDCIEYPYPRQSLLRKKAYQADIVFGTNSSFAFDYLYDHLSMHPQNCVQRNHYYAIIDELDSILIDDADNPHIVSGGMPVNIGKTFQQQVSVIQELLSIPAPVMYETDKLKKTAWFTEAGKQWIEDRCGQPGLFGQCRKSKVKDLRSLPLEEQLRIDNLLTLNNVFQKLLLAHTVYEKDVDYIVLDNKVVIVDPHTGRLKPSSRWEHGLHTAIEAKEGVTTQKDYDSWAVISLKNYFKLYDRYCGMSGTAHLVEDELKEIYGLGMAIIPPHRPCIRQDHPVRIFRTAAEKDEAVIREVQRLHQEHRPVLIGCINLQHAEEILRKLVEHGLTGNLLSAKSLDKEAYFIAKAGMENAITVATSIAGRGTDILLSEMSRDNGGLAIIGTDLFDSSRIDNQLKGRAGRQGDPGSSLFFVSLEDFIMKNLSNEELERVNGLAEKAPSGLLANEVFLPFVLQAQTNRESYYRSQRQKTALKDDMIAPYRQKFYEERNRILFQPSVVKDIVESLIADPIELENIYKYVASHYPIVHRLLTRECSNNSNAEMMDIPFSESMHLYTVRVNIRECLTRPEYFREEYVRQVVLGAYDKYWKRFVGHLTESLNEDEVKLLPEEYEALRKDINFIILSRLTHSTIPVGACETEETAGCSVSSSKVVQRNRLSDDMPCPCGSGKKYGECHGVHGTRRNKKRRI